MFEEGGGGEGGFFEMVAYTKMIVSVFHHKKLFKHRVAKHKYMKLEVIQIMTVQLSG